MSHRTQWIKQGMKNYIKAFICQVDYDVNYYVSVMHIEYLPLTCTVF